MWRGDHREVPGSDAANVLGWDLAQLGRHLAAGLDHERRGKVSQRTAHPHRVLHGAAGVRNEPGAQRPSLLLVEVVLLREPFFCRRGPPAAVPLDLACLRRGVAAEGVK